MNQSNVIFAYLAIAFVIFITMRGELRTYLGFFFATGAVAPGSAKTASNDAPAGGGSASVGGIDVADAAKVALMFL